MRRRWSIKWEWRDIWVGVFWRLHDNPSAPVWLFICPLPFVVIIGEPISPHARCAARLEESGELCGGRLVDRDRGTGRGALDPPTVVAECSRCQATFIFSARLRWELDAPKKARGVPGLVHPIPVLVAGLVDGQVFVGRTAEVEFVAFSPRHLAVIGDPEQRCSSCGSADLLLMGQPAEWGGSAPGQTEYWCRDCRAKTITRREDHGR